MAKVRLGVALVVEGPVARDIDVLRRSLGDGALDLIVPHITLVAPVNVHGDEIDSCLTLLRNVSAETRPFSVTLGDVETFSPVNPVIYLSVDPVEPVLKLRSKVFQEPLVKEEEFNFVPHLTICDDASEEKIEGALVALADYEQEVTFDRMYLLQKDNGEPWRPIADFAFSAQRTIGTGGLPLQVDVGEVVPSNAQSFLDREWRPYLNTQFGTNRLNYEPLVVVARRDDEVVGVVQAEMRPPACHVRELFIGADTRGQGVAGHLLAALEDAARQQGSNRLTYTVLKDCEAEAYFRHKGWVDDTDVVVEQFDRQMVRLSRTLG